MSECYVGQDVLWRRLLVFFCRQTFRIVPRNLMQGTVRTAVAFCFTYASSLEPRKNAVGCSGTPHIL
jgi:hypothetical protein